MAKSSDSLDLSDLSMPESTVEVTDGLRSVILNDEQTLKKELKSLECPFTWTDYRSKGLKREWSIDSKLRKIDENQEDKEFPWYTFNLNVLLCYEYCRKKSYSEALKALTFCEELITSTDSKGIYENLYQSTKDALFHVVLSSKCHVYFAMGQLNEMTHLLKQVCSYKEMGDASKAAIWGIRALVAMEYGYNGTKDAVEFLKTATEMDSEQAEWPFLHAKCLSRTRRLENFVMIPEVELDLLAKAAETTNNPNYVIFLAQAYREKSFRMFCWASKPIDQKLKKELDLMARRSYDLYRQALELRPDWGNINIRCAQGFSRLPPPYRDYKLAKECCEKALMLMPENEMVLHVKAQLCERIDNDMINAKKYYKLAAEGGVYGACMDLLRINYNEDKTYDPIPELNNILERFIEKPLKEDILCQMGSYYFFVKDDLLEGYQYWYKVIDDNPHSEKLKMHKNFFLNTKKPINICEVIYDEARLSLRNKTYKLEAENETLTKIVSYMKERFPELEDSSPIPRRKMIMDETDYDYLQDSGCDRNQNHEQGRDNWRSHENTTTNQNRGRGRENWRSRENAATNTPDHSSNRNGYHSRDRGNRSRSRGNSRPVDSNRGGHKSMERNWRTST